MAEKQPYFKWQNVCFITNLKARDVSFAKKQVKTMTHFQSTVESAYKEAAFMELLVIRN